jgi:hypothetical protein
MIKAQSIAFGTSQVVQPPNQIQDRIRQRAHEIYEARGREHDLKFDREIIAKRL